MTCDRDLGPNHEPSERRAYSGWPVIDASETDGWYYGEITGLCDDPKGCTSGDGFVVAPDGGRAGIAWEVGAFSVLEVLPPSEQSWGVYNVAFPHPVRDLADLVACFRAVLPDLQRIHRRVHGDGEGVGP